MLYRIEIIETLSKIVEIEAKNFDEAYKKIKQNYIDEKIVLDNENFIDYDIKEFQD